MEKETLETITQQLDRLEKTVAEMNQKLSAAVEAVATDTRNGFEAQDSNQGDNIGTKVIAEIFKKMGISEDFELRPIEELHESMKQHGIRAEDNEFSRAIMEEREK
jgi:methyl-accepting chemotaxis protein